MGFWSSLWSGVKEVVTGAAKVVSNVIKTVGGAVVETAGKFLDMGIDKFRKTAEVVVDVAKALGIVKNETEEDIGDRAMRAERRREEFSSTNDYVDYLRTEIKPTPVAELEKLPPEERLARKAIGSALLSKAISEKKAVEIPAEFWKEVVELGLTAKEVDEFLTKFKNAGVSPNDFLKYLKRELDVKEEEKTESALIEAYKELEPEADIKDIEEKVVRLQGI